MINVIKILLIAKCRISAFKWFNQVLYNYQWTEILSMHFEIVKVF